MSSEVVHRYRDLQAHCSARVRAREHVRDAVVWALALRAQLPHGRGWIRFPYYHHVFDDERARFARQLRYLRNHGEFIDLDAAVDLLERGDPIDGCYFCITFDDGFRNCLTNAAPILVENGARAAFFLPTSFIGTSIAADRQRILGFYGPGKSIVEFLDWDEVRELARADMTIGSHTVHHVRLSGLSSEEVERELESSKSAIERELGVPCVHFCAPRGRPGLDYDPERDPEIARRLGYRSFLSTQRGSSYRTPQPMALERDHTIAYWRPYQLRYFLAR